METNQLRSMVDMLECANRRITGGWNAKDENARSIELSAAEKIVSEVAAQLSMQASDQEQKSVAAHKAKKGSQA